MSRTQRFFWKRNKRRRKSENIYAEITRFQKKLGQEINVSNIVKVNKYLLLVFPIVYILKRKLDGLSYTSWAMGGNSNMRKYLEWIHGHEQEIGRFDLIADLFLYFAFKPSTFKLATSILCSRPQYLQTPRILQQLSYQMPNMSDLCSFR